MGKQVVKINRHEIVDEIIAGNNCSGARYLVVNSDGAVKTVWADNNAQWAPWQADDYVIGIPALAPDGSSDELEDAEEFLRDILSVERFAEIEEEIEEGDINWIDAAIREDETAWQISIRERADWLAEGFLSACNGDGSDLNRPEPWGYTSDEFGNQSEIIPPFDFEWAEEE